MFKNSWVVEEIPSRQKRTHRRRIDGWTDGQWFQYTDPPPPPAGLHIYSGGRGYNNRETHQWQRQVSASDGGLKVRAGSAIVAQWAKLANTTVATVSLLFNCPPTKKKKKKKKDYRRVWVCYNWNDFIMPKMIIWWPTKNALNQMTSSSFILPMAQLP